MKKLLVLLCLSAFSSFAQAGNLDTTDSIFNQTSEGGWAQVFLGGSQLLAAQFVGPAASLEALTLQDAEKRLAYVRYLPVSEAERSQTIKMILDNTDNYAFTNGISVGSVKLGVGSQLTDEAQELVAQIQTSPLVTNAEKLAMIDEASNAVADARVAAVTAAQNMGLLSKAVRVVQRGAQVLLILDVSARVYVWNALDKNPTFSPGATFLVHTLGF